MRKSRRIFLLGLGALFVVGAALAIPPVRRFFNPLMVRMVGKRTIEDRVQEFSAARGRMDDACQRAGVSFPPAQVVLLGLKDEKRLEVYAGPTRDSLRRIADYSIQAASGALGPKLKDGDRQVPEGVYALESLNPNSKFHVALRVAYPNDFDRAMAGRDGRMELGGDIMIHGGAASIGCLAMGDDAAEDLFVLTAGAGAQNVTIVISPVDLRRRTLPAELKIEQYHDLYAAITHQLKMLPP